MPAVRPAAAGLLPAMVIGLASVELSEMPLTAVALEPPLTWPPPLPIPPVTAAGLPVTASSTVRLAPSARVNFSVPSAALPLTVMPAFVSAVSTVLGSVSAVSSEAVVMPAPAAVLAPCAASCTPPTDSE